MGPLGTLGSQWGPQYLRLKTLIFNHTGEKKGKDSHIQTARIPGGPNNIFFQSIIAKGEEFIPIKKIIYMTQLMLICWILKKR